MQTATKLVLLICVMFGIAPAHAQPTDPGAGKVTVARRLYEEGVEAVNKCRWSVAHDRFKASYDLSPRVFTLFNLAGAQAQTSRYVEASESYRRFLRETGEGRHTELRAEATSALDDLEKQIAYVTIDVTGALPGDSITIDEVVFPQSALRERLPVNPGSHVIAVRRGATPITSKSVTVAPGGAETVAMTVPAANLQVSPPRDAEPGVTGGSFATRDEPRRERSVLRSPWLWTAVGVAVVGGAVGAYYLTRPDGDVLVVR